MTFFTPPFLRLEDNKHRLSFQFRSPSTVQDGLKQWMLCKYSLQDVYVLDSALTPLLYAASIYDEELCMDICTYLRHEELKFYYDSILCSEGTSGYTCMHYGIQGNLVQFCESVLRDLPQKILMQLVFNIKTQDISILSGGSYVQSGGYNLFHFCVLECHWSTFNILVELLDKRVLLDSLDANGYNAIELACIFHKNSNFADIMTHWFPSSKKVGYSAMAKQVEISKIKQLVSQRYTFPACHLSIGDQIPQFTDYYNDVYVLNSFWPPTLCKAILIEMLHTSAQPTPSSTSVSKRIQHEWKTSRHSFFPTTDLPTCFVMSTNAWIRNHIEQQLFPIILAKYHLQPELHQITIRDLFYVKYQVSPQQSQQELSLHQDGSFISFNILLNEPTAFQGGGTYFPHLKKNFQLNQGDLLLHGSKLFHSGQKITSGSRLLLVGFLNVLPNSLIFSGP